MLEDNLRNWLEADLQEMAKLCMPFGKYGPKNYPPRGVPLYDLPVEYLEWFRKKGFPKGRLGELLRSLHEMKVEGCDEIFDPIRRARGGRTKLREERRKNHVIRTQENQ